ncbi:hypothetical protein F1737_04055 [Methanoplanus sp. FWC-SCC4]|uniref:Uncharacterized protein n=1 Tax=Methanochimaera problematica TaxID=2609417 RepID=A0AA97I2T3_9EURY|nr:hypothetical protein [Methanoplanus sp. FWC-SCC4]WOF15928.1 hypothetical protein F1737_04055 [Methanoplanus sp. FWC-SCC4]
MMQRTTKIGVVFFLVVAFALAVPAMADTMSTGVSIAAGGGDPPVIMCKWEQDESGYLEEGDISHIWPGSQFLPNTVFEGTTTIKYYAVLFDEQDGGNVKIVSAYVYHPDLYGMEEGDWEPFKYQVRLSKVGHGPDEIAMVEDAVMAGLVEFGYTNDGSEVVWNGDDKTSVKLLLEKGTADLWEGEAIIHYCQPAGEYEVVMKAMDQNDVAANDLVNVFDYLPVDMAEFDFASVDYGSTTVCTNKWATGNTIFLDEDGYPTVRNVGNIPLNVVIVRQDDMGFGYDNEGNWDVTFDARLGNDGVGQVITYDPVKITDPGQNAVLPNILWMCHSEELDFSIHILKGWYTDDPHIGTMTLGTTPSEIAPSWSNGGWIYYSNSG